VCGPGENGERGQVIRQPKFFGKGKKPNGPQQERPTSRHVVPRGFGLAFLACFEELDMELCEPSIRAYMEQQVNQIATGETEKNEVVANNLKLFLDKFLHFRDNLAKVERFFAPKGQPGNFQNNQGNFQQNQGNFQQNYQGNYQRNNQGNYQQNNQGNYQQNNNRGGYSGQGNRGGRGGRGGGSRGGGSNDFHQRDHSRSFDRQQGGDNQFHQQQRGGGGGRGNFRGGNSNFGGRGRGGGRGGNQNIGCDGPPQRQQHPNNNQSHFNNNRGGRGGGRGNNQSDRGRNFERGGFVRGRGGRGGNNTSGEGGIGQKRGGGGSSSLPGSVEPKRVHHSY